MHMDPFEGQLIASKYMGSIYWTCESDYWVCLATGLLGREVGQDFDDRKKCFQPVFTTESISIGPENKFEYRQC